MKKLIAALCALSILFTILFTLPACKKKTGDEPETTAAYGDGAGTPTDETTVPAGETASLPAGETATAAETQTDAQGNAVTAVPSAAQTAAPTRNAETTAAVSGPAAPAVTAAATSVASQSAAPPASSAGDKLALTINASRMENLKKGDTFDVTVGIRNATWLASVTVNLNYDNNILRVEKMKEKTISDFDTLINDYGNYVRFAGYTMNTIDIAENALFTVTFKVLSVPSDRAVTLDMKVQQLDLGTDARGVKTRSVQSELELPSLRLGFAG